MMMEEDCDPEPIYAELDSLVKKLEEKGVSRDRLKRSARRMGLSDCSYGSQSWVNPVMMTLWGVVGGLAASYVCDGICDHFQVSKMHRITADVFSLALPTLYCFTAGCSEREQKDYTFYVRLKEVFKDRLAR